MLLWKGAQSGYLVNHKNHSLLNRNSTILSTTLSLYSVRPKTLNIHIHILKVIIQTFIYTKLSSYLLRRDDMNICHLNLVTKTQIKHCEIHICSYIEYYIF